MAVVLDVDLHVFQCVLVDFILGCDLEVGGSFVARWDADE